MKTRIRTMVITALTLCTLAAWADDQVPTISPTATYLTDDGSEPDPSQAVNAPITVRFEANPENVGDYSATYEWRFWRNTMEGEPYLVRYEQDTEYTFTKDGDHYIACYATFVNGNDTIAYTDDYWSENTALKCSISESILEMPNAFSPNGDEWNQTYTAKKYRSIVEFHATIFNRWGQKLYEWDDPAGGWDGKFNGKDVKQGVYYVLVRAKGADGRKYNIRKDVNLLRGYDKTQEGSTDAGNP